MRKILLSIISMTVTILSLKTTAQTGCSGGANNCALAISNTVVELISTESIGPSQCKVTFNVEFDLTYNSGNKYIFIHSWLVADYPDYFPCGSGAESAPTNANGGKLGTAVDDPGMSFLDIGLDNTVDRGAVGVPVNIPILTTYPADGSVIMTSPAGNSPLMTATKTFVSGSTDHVKMTNVVVIVNTACSSGVIVKTSVWSSNAASATTAQCWFTDITQTFNEPAIAFVRNCTAPRTYSVGLTTVSTTDIHVTYRIYADDDGDDVFEPGTDDPLLFTSGVITLKDTDPYSALDQTLPNPWCCVSPWSESFLWIQVSIAEYGNSLLREATNECAAPLPVSLKSFTAVRNNSYVNLKWETALEENSKGFVVQRKVGNSEWQSIGYLETKAINGNSSSPLNYDFTDFNNLKGITQYRLRQLDIDGKIAYSQIRSVRGTQQKGKIIVYPNPSSDGNVNVVFEDKDASRNISLLDVNGRIIKQWKNVLSNTLQIDNLVSGFYTLRIINTETNEQVVEKIVVKSR